MSEPTVTYETPRLLLRPSDERMTFAVLEFYRKNVEEFSLTEPISAPNFLTDKYQRTLLKSEKDLAARHSMLRLWIYLKDFPDILVGTVSCHNIRYNDFQDCEIGYKIDPAFRRRGFAREAVTKMRSIMLGPPYMLHRINAIVLPDNLPSISLLESLGFEREGLLRHNVRLNGVWKSHYLYSYLNEK